MSMLDGQGQNGTANDEQQSGEGSQGTEQGTQQQEPENPFLANVPDEDKPVLSKYIKQWDAGVQRKILDLHRQYEPYKNLGDVEELQRAAQFVNYFRQNPQAVYEQLKQAFEQQQQAPMPQQQGQGFGANQQQGAYPEELAPYFQQFDQRFQSFNQFQNQTTQVLQALSNFVLEQHRAAQEAKDDTDLDNYLNLLKTEMGDFDEQYVLTKMAAGMSGEDAVKDWKTRIQQQVNASRAPSVGPVLNGGGGTPPVGKSVTELSKKETRDLVATVLAQSKQQA